MPTPQQEARLWRAAHQPIAATAMTEAGELSFAVRGSTGEHYTVRKVGRRLLCSCPDAARPALVCKHCCLIAMRLMTASDRTRFLCLRRLPLAGWTVTCRNSECSLCLEALPRRVATCVHCLQGFHAPCLGRWVAHRTASAAAATCPMCRGLVTVAP